MGKFLTSPAISEQLPQRGLYRLCVNELYQDDDGAIYLAWRNFKTDQFTWINSSDWDTRCAHGHDVGCKYHQVVRVKLTELQLYGLGYLYEENGRTVCKDIPADYLEVVNVGGHWINNLFYRMLKSANCPKTPMYVQIGYRIGVAFNVGWFKSGKVKIDLNRLYDREWNE